MSFRGFESQKITYKECEAVLSNVETVMFHEDDAEGFDEDVEDAVNKCDVDIPACDNGLCEPEDERTDKRDLRDFAHCHARSIEFAL